MTTGPDVSIIIPVLNKLAFTRQCLDRIWRNSGASISYEIVIVDNGSHDGTEAWFSADRPWPSPLRYHRNAVNLGFAKGNNLGAGLSVGRDLLFLNNDTLVQPGWLPEMVRVLRSHRAVGIVGIKQLFPYTNVIYHTGMVFGPDRMPQHLYPHLDASLPQVNQEREYQAVTGACLLIERALFDQCGRFDEAYVNGYEDVDLCMQARQRGRKIVCCTSAYIYHYGQISEGRTDADDRNAARFAQKWGHAVRVDRDEYLARDSVAFRTPLRGSTSGAAPGRRLADDCIYFADDLDDGSALTWFNAELAVSLADTGVPVFVNASKLSSTLPASTRDRLRRLDAGPRPLGGVQIKWSHYRPRHLALELAGDINLELFVINYLFGQPGREPWDYWLQCLRQNGSDKLPLSEFCHEVLLQLGLTAGQSHVLHPGYAPEIHQVDAPRRRDSSFRFLTVTNSHDLERYNTRAVLDAFDSAFSPDDDVTLVIKDYGASSGDRTIRDILARRARGPRIEYVSAFTDKRDLIALYKGSDAFVSAHRGEGFGMKILDAMACGVPVITPLFGGPTAFCTAENCLPVAFSLVPMGDCLDSRALHITNDPRWAEVAAESLREQLRSAFDRRSEAARLGARGRDEIVARFSWARSAARLVEIADRLRSSRPRTPKAASTPATHPERSPYWLGLRISVVIPTRNRRDKLTACLEALSRQSILPQEFEVVVVDDGSTDGTLEWLEGRHYPFRLRCFRQEGQGPGAARNLGVEQAEGELVLFIGDDIYADERLLEEHLLAHASRPAPGAAVLGHIDWPADMSRTAVMDYVCGDAMLQFAYTYIRTAPALDHRFFYTSNVSLKRGFLSDAAAAGIGFDPAFYHAAFEDSELAYRLMPRGLTIRYAAAARVTHDHWMDLDAFMAREHRAGAMAVVFYRKHPGLDDQLQVRWIADLIEPAEALRQQPDLLARLAAFDRDTDTLLRSFAASLDGLVAIGTPAGPKDATVPNEKVRAALYALYAVIFDVERTRGKLSEWFATVTDPDAVRTAQVLASVSRKIEFLTSGAAHAGALPVDAQDVADLRGQLAQIPGLPAARAQAPPAVRNRARRLLESQAMLTRLVRVDRFLEARVAATMGTEWAERYRGARRRLRTFLLG